MQNSLRALALLLPAVLFACNKHDEAPEHAEEHSEEGGHTHEPLIEGGSLIELGDHEANLEVHLKPETGLLEIYLLDGHASKTVRSSQVSLMVTVQPEKGDPYTLTLPHVASTLSGETVGDSSKYQIQDDRLKGVTDLDAKVALVSMQGSTYKDVEITWPAGEHDH
jgi:hypothetical protein